MDHRGNRCVILNGQQVTFECSKTGFKFTLVVECVLNKGVKLKVYQGDESVNARLPEGVELLDGSLKPIKPSKSGEYLLPKGSNYNYVVVKEMYYPLFAVMDVKGEGSGIQASLYFPLREAIPPQLGGPGILKEGSGHENG